MLQEDLAKIKELYGSWLVDVRRHLHSHPELSDKEVETQKFIMDKLTEMGVENHPIARTGVVGLIRGQEGGKTVALRADIDALPMQDQKDVPYRSQNDGVCHACGHDAHTTIALGVARYFSQRRDQFKGNIKLLFQPAEEAVGGANRMVQEGCMENPHVDYCIGKHVMAYMDVGEVEVKNGKLNASTDGIRITIKGKAGHGAYPETGVDAILAAAAVVQGVHTLVARNVSPLESLVISLGTIRGGTKGNIICDEVVLGGTMRTVNEELRRKTKERLKTMVESIAAGYGAQGEVSISPGYDSLINNDEIVKVIEDVAVEHLGRDKVHQKEFPSMGAEDFSFFLNEAPGAFYHLGCGNKSKGITALGHAVDFDIDEDCLPVGVFLDIQIISELLQR